MMREINNYSGLVINTLTHIYASVNQVTTVYGKVFSLMLSQINGTWTNDDLLSIGP